MQIRFRALLCLFIIFTTCPGLTAQTKAHELVASVSAASTTARISIDGKLTEQAWQEAVPFTDFLQRDPDEGKPATERTQIRFLYDERFLYVGVELFDSDAAQIVSRLSRRDNYPDSDSFSLYLDPYHDHLTGVLFQVSAAGVQQDSVISNDTNTDNSWDSVWESAVSRSESGWFLEMRIPFSQLRFGSSEHFMWGVNATRFIHRKNETSWLQLVPKSEYGLASRMAHLIGGSPVKSSHNLEVRPYARTSTELSPAIPGDPFHDGTRQRKGFGVDLKYGISSNMILDATVNPDFAQVEADPAVVNLSASETFFSERRPFFLEGSQLFNNFGRGGGGGDSIVFPTFFYSRRIGRTPQGPASGTYVDRPAAATILGAAKLTGKTSNGWSFGVLNALTDSSSATVIDAAGLESKIEIEPFANHFIGRVLREIPGRGGFGFLATGTERKLRTTTLQNLMPRQGHVAGTDGYYYFDKKRNWLINWRMAGSLVSGSATAIDRMQRSSLRYYQRPDATYLHYNPTATSLAGWHSGMLLKNNQGGLLFSTSLAATNPGFDSNDSGFQTNSDQGGYTAQLTWRQVHTDGFSRYRDLWIFRNEAWNFGGNRKYATVRVGGSLNFLNYWNVFGNASYNQHSLDDRLTRGGPITTTAADRNFFIGFNSDGRKRVNFGGNTSYSYNDYHGWGSFTGAYMNLKPASSLTVSVEPNFNRSRGFAQYVRSVDDVTAVGTYGKRYVFADLDQSSAGMTNRVNWGITPNVSLQVYSQVLFSAGDYWDIKELAKPRTLSFLRYGHETGSMSYAGKQYTVDPDGSGPAAAFSMSDPNFNFKSWQVNAVFRWEYKPGSTLFLVWTHNQTDSQYPGSISPVRDMRALFGAPANNGFLVKTSYWFNR